MINYSRQSKIVALNKLCFSVTTDALLDIRIELGIANGPSSGIGIGKRISKCIGIVLDMGVHVHVYVHKYIYIETRRSLKFQFAHNKTHFTTAYQSINSHCSSVSVNYK